MSANPVSGLGIAGPTIGRGGVLGGKAKPSADLMRAELESKRSRVIGDIVDISLERMAESRERREAEDVARRRQERADELDRQELEAQVESERRRARLLEALARGGSDPA